MLWFLTHYVIVFAMLFPLLGQSQTINNGNDTLDTPFRKGRWLTGLSGSISSNSTEVRGSDEKTTTNEFGLNISTGTVYQRSFAFWSHA